jgi:hypothetical protein
VNDNNNESEDQDADENEAVKQTGRSSRTYLILSLPRMNSNDAVLPIMFTLPMYPPTLRQMLHWHIWYGTGVLD